MTCLLDELSLGGVFALASAEWEVERKSAGRGQCPGRRTVCEHGMSHKSDVPASARAFSRVALSTTARSTSIEQQQQHAR